MTAQALGQPVPHEGRLGDVSLLPRLLAFLARSEWSGAVSVLAGDVERSIFLAYASSRAREPATSPPIAVSAT